jgi:hypothetical protein
MELIDLIKSNVFLISLYVGLILIISFIIYKIRNQAKYKKVGDFSSSKPDNGITNESEKNLKVQKLKDDSSNFENDTSNNFSERYKEKFIVMNKVQEDKRSLKSRPSRDPGFTEFYEITDSRLMFKFKPHPYEAIEE